MLSEKDFKSKRYFPLSACLAQQQQQTVLVFILGWPQEKCVSNTYSKPFSYEIMEHPKWILKRFFKIMSYSYRQSEKKIEAGFIYT